ncbi:MAG: DMT family transporter [Proteobacteria bacterium]|nr:DMT family transporter [Pseudomonadota bacterium]
MTYAKGILLKLLNIALFTAISILSARVGRDLHKLQLFWMICAFAIIVVSIPMLLFNKQQLFALNCKSFLGFALRSLCNVLGMWAWLEAISHIGANTSSAISYMTPIFTTVLAVLLLKEKLATSCLLAIMTSFVGLCVVLQPSSLDMLSYGGMMGLFSCLMWAVHDIVCKKQTFKEQHFIQAWYVFLFSMIISTPSMLLLWQPISSYEVSIIALIGAIAAANVVVIFLAYKAAPITVLMPFSYCKFIFMAIAAYIFLDENIMANTIAGALIIASSSAYIFYNQSKMQQLERVTNRKNFAKTLASK